MAADPQTVILSLGGEGVDEEELARQRRALAEILQANLEDAEVSLAEGATDVPGAKGLPIVGLVIAGLKAAGPLLSGLAPIFARNRSLVITIKRPDGGEVTVNATNVKDDRTLKIVEMALFGTT